MAQNRRLIDADALEQAVFATASKFGSELLFIDVIIDDIIGNAPEVEAVEVVRCKDCKHNQERRGETLCDNPMGIFRRNTADDFCSHGERKRNEG